MYKRKFERNDKRDLLLFGYSEHLELPSKQLEPTEIPKPHMRWNPARQEWVTYSDSRKNRTAFPPKEYCPLCPGANLDFPTEIPFKDFEVAIFPNRWASFNSHNQSITLKEVLTKNSNGKCEVVVYSSKHLDTIAQMPLDRIKLLLHAWIDRYEELLKQKDIEYVMPFENRGEECGVTLHHPHGQIYAFPFIPPVIKKEIEAFKKDNFLLKLMNKLENKYYVYQDKNIIAAVPPFARYAYEIWIAPKRQLPGPWAFNDEEKESFAIAMQKVVKAYDSFMGKKCPYIMGLHAAPQINDSNFHFHIEFYPPLRYEDKPKILAGSESMAGVFVMDVLPEETAITLRKHIQ
ncbi:MAG: galactose-1-phosphate uridylyltransferase [Candidatus Marinimicrobia bacterium]|nr:galactose-1-phosphate uridylyltransferase [Candidatus Neomarinimicrobiota bacterium]